MKKIQILFLVLVMLMTSSVQCFAAPNGGNPGTVTEEMTSADFWKKNTPEDPDKVLLTPEEIEEYNAALIADSADTLMRDLENITPEYDASALLKNLLAETATPTTQYYIDGKAIDNEAYFSAIRKDLEKTAFKGERTVQYAVVTTHADMKAIPTNDMLMDSLTDTADEFQSSALLVNEPFIIKQKCEREGTTFYWGHSQNVPGGWIDGANLAICQDRSEWLEAWKIDDINAKDFIVIAQDKVYLDKSTDPSYPAGLYLGLGAALKLVEPENIPVTVGERGTWGNYVVYVPGRNEDGSYVRKMGLIASHYSVHVGYLPYTQSNILDLAFSCQGNRYGWGNMFGNMDCSGYIRNILRCFGFNFPRNTTTQRKIEGTDVDLTGFKTSELTAFLKTLPAGSLLYFSGHGMIYIGTVNDVPYAISSVATLSDTQGEVNIVKYLSVLVTPLTVRRASGNTWLYSLQDAVILPHRENIASFDVSVYKEKGADDSSAAVTVKNDDKELTYGEDFIAMNPTEEGYEGYVTAIGTGDYTGIHSRTRISYYGHIYKFTDLMESAWYAEAAKYVIDRGLMAGTSAEKFSPDDELPKKQLACVLYNAAGKPKISADTEGYEDVAENAYYEKASLWAKETDIFGDAGNDGNLFNGDSAVSRMMVIQGMYRLSRETYEQNAEDLIGFTDTETLSESEAEALAWAVSKGLVSGYPDGTIRPYRPLTRIELTSVLYKYMQR